MSVYEYVVQDKSGGEVSLGDYEGNVLLIVNTATKCGLANQFEGLEALHQKYESEGLRVLGFPCNQFMNQEPVSDENMAQECKINFGVTFPLFKKIQVNGKDADPLYKYLKTEQKGLLGSDIKWNFTKFLVDRKGNVVKRFAPKTKPEQIEQDIQELL
ncbi:UNVERIFIED_CONTAM: glutathione peroxidase [Halobacillus marinus]|uniref:glutathione peroxidase n=1 Tax=Bacillaceae TaxID=186817 RepID=UPI0002A4E33E|nr:MULTISPECIES: glutathione peroxidase [Bacillaceae]ELK45607.1 glutathione peroxidase [Halobacillus sp. BAB-2008]QHT46079.1 glutathione peroxidase [Bacillus sp. SB49]